MENEKRNLEKEILLQKSEFVKEKNISQSEKTTSDSNDNNVHERCHAIYEKLSKIYKCSYDKDRITLTELDSYIAEPYNLDSIHCEDDYTKKRLIKLIEPCMEKK